MRIALRCGLGLLLFALAARAEEVVVIPYAPALGVATVYRMESVSEEVGNATDRLREVNVIAITALSRNDQGYVMEAEYRDIEMTSPAALPFLKELAELGRGVTLRYQADATGSPVTLLNLSEVQAVMNKGLDLIAAKLPDDLRAIGLPEDQLPALMAILAGLGAPMRDMAQDVADQQLLEEVRILHIATGGSYSPGYANQYHADTVIEPTGTPVDGVGRFEIAAYDADTARIVWSFAPEPSALQATIAALVGQLGVDDADLAAALRTFASAEQASATLDRKDGLPIKVEYQRRLTAGASEKTSRMTFTRLP